MKSAALSVVLSYLAAASLASAQRVADVKELNPGFAYFVNDQVTVDGWVTKAWDACLASCKKDPQCTSVMLAGHDPAGSAGQFLTGRCYRSHGSFIETRTHTNDPSKLYRAHVGDAVLPRWGTGNVGDESSHRADTTYFAFPGWTADAALNGGFLKTRPELRDIVSDVQMLRKTASLTDQSYKECTAHCQSKGALSYSATGRPVMDHSYTLVNCKCFNKRFETAPLNQRKNGIATAIPISVAGPESSKMANVYRS